MRGKISLEHARDEDRKLQGKTDRADRERLGQERLKGVAPAEWPAYFRMLSMSLSAGVTVTNALGTFCDSPDISKELKDISGRILRKLESGQRSPKGVL